MKPLILFLMLTLIGKSLFSQGVKKDSLLKNTTVEGTWFLAYQYGDDGKDTISLFTLKRGYLTVKQKFSKTFEARFTQDITLDEEGSDAGNVEMRLKYCYLKINLPDAGFFTHPFLEVGLAHRPWIDYEEKINHYRVQGSMFLDRNKVLSSADFGVMAATFLGGKLDDEVAKNFRSSYPGKYGSIAVGVYNGGGYYAIEQNRNKIVEGRLSLRPFPSIMPGMQLSFIQTYGAGNDPASPLYMASVGALTYECGYFTTVAQYYQGTGNFMGTFADSLGTPTDNKGFSVFFEGKIPKSRFAVIGRYDHFERYLYKDVLSRRVIAGIAYNIFNQSKIVIDLDYLKKDGKPDNWVGEVAVEINF